MEIDGACWLQDVLRGCLTVSSIELQLVQLVQIWELILRTHKAGSGRPGVRCNG